MHLELLIRSLTVASRSQGLSIRPCRLSTKSQRHPRSNAGATPVSFRTSLLAVARLLDQPLQLALQIFQVQPALSFVGRRRPFRFNRWLFFIGARTPRLDLRARLLDAPAFVDDGRRLELGEWMQNETVLAALRVAASNGKASRSTAPKDTKIQGKSSSGSSPSTGSKPQIQSSLLRLSEERGGRKAGGAASFALVSIYDNVLYQIFEDDRWRMISGPLRWWRV